MKITVTRNHSVNVTKTLDLDNHVGEDQTWESIEELWDDADLELPVPPFSEWTNDQIEDLIAVAEYDDRVEEWPDDSGTLLVCKVE